MDDFIKACVDSNIDEPFQEDCFHPLVRTLSLWGEANGFTDVASRVKKLLRVYSRIEHARAVCLLECFACAFNGMSVGTLGRDVVEPFLHHRAARFREAAVFALEKWGVDDYSFVEMLADQYEREQDGELSNHIQVLLADFGYSEENQDGALCGECPECGEGDIDEDDGTFWCTECGSEYGDQDPRIQDLEKLFSCGDEPEAEIPRQELLPWNLVASGATNHLHSAVCTEQLPHVLEGIVGIHPHLTVDMIESYKIGAVSTRSTTLNLFVGSYAEEGLHTRVWFWSDTYAGCFHLLTRSNSGAPERWALEVQWK